MGHFVFSYRANFNLTPSNYLCSWMQNGMKYTNACIIQNCNSCTNSKTRFNATWWWFSWITMQSKLCCIPCFLSIIFVWHTIIKWTFDSATALFIVFHYIIARYCRYSYNTEVVCDLKMQCNSVCVVQERIFYVLGNVMDN